MTANHWVSRPLRFPNGGAEPGPDHTLVGGGRDQQELFAELWARPDTLVLSLNRDRVLIDGDARLALVPASVIDEVVQRDDVLKLYLGRVTPDEGIPDDGVLVAGEPEADATEVPVPVIAVVLTDHESAELSVGTWSSLRDVTATLHPRDVGLSTRAIALANWHRSHSFSPRSGHTTQPSAGGWVRLDTADGSEHFPRTDPAVIVAVTDQDDRILLASNVAWDERVFSLIAGFVDPGESLEQAVVREVFEEAGVPVRDPKYLGSQPWPFPASLMLGFQATAIQGAETGAPDGVEIRALRWFTREELSRAVAAGEVILPGSASISRALINAWHGAPPISS